VRPATRMATSLRAPDAVQMVPMQPSAETNGLRCEPCLRCILEVSGHNCAPFYPVAACGHAGD